MRDDDQKTTIRPPRSKPPLSWLAPTVVAAGLIAVVIAVAVSSYRSPESTNDATDDTAGVAAIGKPAPDFEVDLISGVKFNLRAARGKVVLVNFWGTWCAPCEKEMPLLERASREFKDDVIIVGLAVNDTKNAVESFALRHSITFPIAQDNGKIAGFYLVSGFPTSVIVDRNGVVVSRVSRAFPDYEELRRQLEAALK